METFWQNELSLCGYFILHNNLQYCSGRHVKIDTTEIHKHTTKTHKHAIVVFVRFARVNDNICQTIQKYTIDQHQNAKTVQYDLRSTLSDNMVFF